MFPEDSSPAFALFKFVQVNIFSIISFEISIAIGATLFSAFYKATMDAESASMDAKSASMDAKSSFFIYHI